MPDQRISRRIGASQSAAPEATWTELGTCGGSNVQAHASYAQDSARARDPFLVRPRALREHRCGSRERRRGAHGSAPDGERVPVAAPGRDPPSSGSTASVAGTSRPGGVRRGRHDDGALTRRPLGPGGSRATLDAVRLIRPHGFFGARAVPRARGARSTSPEPRGSPRGVSVPKGPDASHFSARRDIVAERTGGKMRILMPLAAAFAGALSLATGATADPLNVRVAWVVPVGNWASILYEKKDLMTHYGKTYTVEPIHFQSTPTMIAALAAGELDIADLAYSSFAHRGRERRHDRSARHRRRGAGRRHGLYLGELRRPRRTGRSKPLTTSRAGSSARWHRRRARHSRARHHAPARVRGPARLHHGRSGVSQHAGDDARPQGRPDPGGQPIRARSALQDNTRPLFNVTEAMQGPTQTIIWTAHKDFLDKNRAAMVDLFEDAVRVARFLSDPKNHAETVADRRQDRQAAARAHRLCLHRPGRVTAAPTCAPTSRTCNAPST